MRNQQIINETKEQMLRDNQPLMESKAGDGHYWTEFEVMEHEDHAIVRLRVRTEDGILLDDQQRVDFLYG